jgi:hypothetical protein
MIISLASLLLAAQSPPTDSVALRCELPMGAFNVMMPVGASAASFHASPGSFRIAGPARTIYASPSVDRVDGNLAKGLSLWLKDRDSAPVVVTITNYDPVTGTAQFSTRSELDPASRVSKPLTWTGECKSAPEPETQVAEADGRFECRYAPRGVSSPLASLAITFSAIDRQFRDSRSWDAPQPADVTGLEPLIPGVTSLSFVFTEAGSVEGTGEMPGGGAIALSLMEAGADDEYLLYLTLDMGGATERAFGGKCTLSRGSFPPPLAQADLPRNAGKSRAYIPTVEGVTEPVLDLSCRLASRAREWSPLSLRLSGRRGYRTSSGQVRSTSPRLEILADPQNLLEKLPLWQANEQTMLFGSERGRSVVLWSAASPPVYSTVALIPRGPGMDRAVGDPAYAGFCEVTVTPQQPLSVEEAAREERK